MDYDPRLTGNFELGKSLASGVGGSIVGQAVRGGRVSAATLATDAFGNVLGDSIAAANGQKAIPAPVSADERRNILGLFADGPGSSSTNTAWNAGSQQVAFNQGNNSPYIDMQPPAAGLSRSGLGSGRLNLGAASSAAASGKAARLAGDAQATSNSYAGGAGDIRETVTPINASGGGRESYMDAQGTIQVLGQRMTKAEAAAFDAQLSATLGPWRPAPVSAGNAFSMGWNQQSWTTLEHGSQSQQLASSFVYGVGQGTRSLVDGLTGAASMRQAQDAWRRGEYVKAPLYGMQALGEAGLTVLTLGEYASIKTAVKSVIGARSSTSAVDVAAAVRTENAVGLPVTRSSNPLSPVLELDAHGNEIMYRSMSPQDYRYLGRTGALRPTTETSISPDLVYSSKYTNNNSVTVRFATEPGTSAALQEIGIAANPPAAQALGLAERNGSWMQTNTRFKAEGGQMTTQLGQGPGITIFNRGIIDFGRMR